MNKSNQVMWFPEGTFKKTEEERERERTLLKKHNPNGEVMWFPEGTFKKIEEERERTLLKKYNPNGEIMYFPEGTFKKEEKKTLTDQFFNFVAAIRDKNIKARIPGVDPLQKNYLKK